MQDVYDFFFDVNSFLVNIQAWVRDLQVARGPWRRAV